MYQLKWQCKQQKQESFSEWIQLIADHFKIENLNNK